MMVVTTGGNVVAIKYVLLEPDIDPLWAAASRFLLAALIFTIIARALRVRFPRGRALVGSVLYGGLTFGGFFGFVYWGLQEAPAGLAGVFLATVPLLTFLLALAQGQELFRWTGLVGAALVVGGTGVILRGGIEEGVPITSLLAIVAGAACAAEGAIVVKGTPATHPAAMNAVGMAVGSMFLFLLMPVFDESYVIPSDASTWWAQAYLVIVGSVGVFALYLYVLGKWSASAASYEFVLVPLVGIVLSAWLLDEAITSVFAAGSIVILVGVYLGALRRPGG
ncbi:MAG TPA: DMT family transporter [Actinomycetota bacterium]|nr:DMT family transporter [Actinomycetota bacterium]